MAAADNPKRNKGKRSRRKAGDDSTENNRQNNGTKAEVAAGPEVDSENTYRRLKLIVMTSVVIALLSIIIAVILSVSAYNKNSLLKKELSELNIRATLTRLEKELKDIGHGRDSSSSIQYERLKQAGKELDSTKNHIDEDINNTIARLNNAADTLDQTFHELHGDACSDRFPQYQSVTNIYSKTCVWLFPGKVTWGQARRQCNQRGLSIAVFPTIEEVEWFNRVQQNINKPNWKTDLWIGLRPVNASWSWDGRAGSSPVLSLNDAVWGQSTPVSGVGGVCGYMPGNKTKIWSRRCSTTHEYYLCE